MMIQAVLNFDIVSPTRMTMSGWGVYSVMKYFIYARKSSESEDRQVQSIDDQVDRLKKLA